MKDNNPKCIFHPIDAIKDSIFSKEAKDIGIDIAENSIDVLIESEILKNLPLVKIVYSIAKFSMAIRDKYLLKKVLVFIATLNQGKADYKEIEKRRRAAKENKKWLTDEIERITIHLDRIDELKKAEITAAFYIEFINQNISWKDFNEYIAIIERVFFQDFMQLSELYRASIEEKKLNKNGSEGVVIKTTRNINCDRLIAVGLVCTERKPVCNGIRTEYNLSSLGLKFAEILQKIKIEI